MARMISVAALQSSYGADLQANIARTADLVREAAGRGAEVILPSELFQGPYFCVAQEERWFADAHPWRPSWAWSSPSRSSNGRGRITSTA